MFDKKEVFSLVALDLYMLSINRLYKYPTVIPLRFLIDEVNDPNL